ncbi:bombyxin A-3 homolog [Plodia interpunctella]|uniref:Neuropeptide ILB1 n=1 Tax=Plodia interpunctella TaxID=58824 RepID=A0A5B8FJN9_PLOIN|nr:bombyxin A-3 homolog [Plodia interpunctella]QDO72232.1 neuropeptide precursor ILB1 [Plodia interpunctella]
MKVQLFSLLIIAAILSVESSNPQFYCGRRLASALAYLCPYEEDALSKRSVDRIQDLEGSWSWFYPKSRALGAMRAKRQGVASECCDKPCDLSELLSYC